MGASVSLYNRHHQSYASIVRTQPNVRTVISFISRNIAQLGIGLYRFIDEDNRERVRDHPFTATMAKPNPLDRRITRYRFVHNLIWDLCTFDVGFAYLVESPGRQALIKLRPDRLDPALPGGLGRGRSAVARLLGMAPASVGRRLRLPQIRDLIISLLGAKSFDEVRSIEGKNFLREEMLLRINSLLVTGKAKSIYFTEFVVQ